MKLYILINDSGAEAYTTLTALCSSIKANPRSVYVALNRSNPCNIRSKGKVYKTNLIKSDNRGNPQNLIQYLQKV